MLERTSKSGDRTDYYYVSDSAWDNAIKARIEGFKNLKNIVEQGTKTSDNEISENRSLLEMLQWVDIMIESHEKALLKWRNET